MKILISDNNSTDEKTLQQLLHQNGYTTLLGSGNGGLVSTTLKESPDLILLGMDVPDEKGYELARTLKANHETRFIPIIMLANLSGLGPKLEGLEAGVDDYISKPFSSAELLVRIRSLLRVKTLNDHLDNAESIVFSLARIIEAKDVFTMGHADRVSKYSVALGKLMNRSEEELEILGRGGLLHDVGKVAIPDSILLKPGQLTSEEFEIMKSHAMVGYTICERLRSAKDALPLIRHHHEKLNGEGYPDGLKGQEIPILVRIVTIVDIYDALTSRRSYKDAWSNERTFKVMHEEVKKGWWDGDVLEVWEDAINTGKINKLLSPSKNS